MCTGKTAPVADGGEGFGELAVDLDVKLHLVKAIVREKKSKAIIMFYRNPKKSIPFPWHTVL